MNKDCSATPSTGALRRRIPHPWRRLHRRTCTTPEPVPVYGFELVSALLHGWQLHVVRQRLIHEQSARSNQHWHYWLGSLAALFTAAAGSSAAVAWEKQTSNASLAFVSALLAALASVFAGIVTFLDLGGRAERHRKAAADHKRALRELEATAPPESMRVADLSNDPDQQISRFINEMTATLSDMDASAPIPPRRIAKRIEARPPELHPSVTFKGIDASPG